MLRTLGNACITVRCLPLGRVRQSSIMSVKRAADGDGGSQGGKPVHPLFANMAAKKQRVEGIYSH